MRSVITIFIFCLSANIAFTQEVWGDTTDAPELVQFSGVVVNGDSLDPVPFTNVYDKVTLRGSMADIYGYFSFVAEAGDTIVFSSIGYKREEFVVPRDLDEVVYSMIQMLELDTFQLDEITIFPFPTKEQFAHAFVNLVIDDSDLQRAYGHLTPQAMAQLAENVSMDGSENYKWSMTQKSATLYYAGQAQPMNIFNPLAWASFIQAWKNGDFKKTEYDDNGY